MTRMPWISGDIDRRTSMSTELSFTMLTLFISRFTAFISCINTFTPIGQPIRLN